MEYNKSQKKEVFIDSNNDNSNIEFKKQTTDNSNEDQNSKGKLKSGSSLVDLSHEGDTTQIIENRLKISTIEEETINKENIWSFTIINVISCTICLVSVFLIETINLSFVGYTEESEINLASVGVGNILLNFTSLFVAFGGLGALDTVGSFCYGKNDMKGLSLAVIRMRLIIIVIFLIFTIPTCMFATEFLQILGISHTVSERSGEYCFYMLPTIFFAFNFNLNVRVLQVIHDYLYISIISILGVIFHYVANFIVFNLYKSNNYINVAHISSISMFLMFLMSVFYLLFFFQL